MLSNSVHTSSPDSVYVKLSNGWVGRANINDVFISKGLNRWEQAYAWGNHAGLYRSVNWVPSVSEVNGLNSALALKADNTYVDSNLASKANTSDVSASLALKADKTYVDNGLASKVSTSDLNSALAAKANARKEFHAEFTPTVANGFVINYASAGFTSPPIVQITPQTSATGLLNLPLVIIGNKTNTQCTVHILSSGNTTVGLLGAVVQGLTYATNLTGIKLNVSAIQP